MINPNLAPMYTRSSILQTFMSRWDLQRRRQIS